MNLIIFGPPGAGKGTQADFIVKKYNLFQLSTGELLRSEIKNKTELGIKISSAINGGSLVSDDIVKKLVEIFISNEKYKDRLIFDGYPRNLIQAKTLNELLRQHNQKIDLVLKLSVSLDIIKKRILERRTLEKRSDDSEEIAIKRYKTYEKSTEPVIEYYKKLNLLKVIDGERSIDQINKEISDIISLI
ncbi:adenylate kinase [Pelagibacterales bacterium SAG-MED29]|nr:adenylate kinase [Pelagibacterales bacterium SAG-MED29]